MRISDWKSDVVTSDRKHRGLLVAYALRGAGACEALHLAGVVLHRVFPAAHGAGVLDRDVRILDAGRVDQRRERAVVPGDGRVATAGCVVELVGQRAASRAARNAGATVGTARDRTLGWAR